MSTNISKQKRDDLISKIKAICTYIASAQQDENTGALLSYLNELEKELKAKKYGLVFEEHREKIDEILATHTPVLTEEKDLFIDNDGQLHFLIEGDNLAALQLLLKTHREKIDLIYISIHRIIRGATILFMTIVLLIRKMVIDTVNGFLF